jgi:hypothetical protein
MLRGTIAGLKIASCRWGRGKDGHPAAWLNGLFRVRSDLSGTWWLFVNDSPQSITQNLHMGKHSNVETASLLQSVVSL